MNNVLKEQLTMTAALQRAVEYHAQGMRVPDVVAESCPYHAKLLNDRLQNLSPLSVFLPVDTACPPADTENPYFRTESMLDSESPKYAKSYPGVWKTKETTPDMSKYEFKIDDIIEQNGHSDVLLVVTGYIHDSERLFVTDLTDRLNNGREFEIPFSEVTRHWRELPNNGLQEEQINEPPVLNMGKYEQLKIAAAAWIKELGFDEATLQLTTNAPRGELKLIDGTIIRATDAKLKQ